MITDKYSFVNINNNVTSYMVNDHCCRNELKTLCLCYYKDLVLGEDLRVVHSCWCTTMCRNLGQKVKLASCCGEH